MLREKALQSRGAAAQCVLCYVTETSAHRPTHRSPDLGQPPHAALAAPLTLRYLKALESYANSPAGNTVFQSQKKHQQVLVGKTVRTVINDFLSHVSSSPNDPDTGFIDIEYTYGKRTSALVATGWITGGREYAKNADPFKLPKFLRNRALCRFGYDFDDSCSYPRAAFRAIRFHAHLAGILVRNREEIMEKIGLLIFSTTKTDVERRKLIKHLINLLDMDGSYAGWRAIHNIPPHLTLGDEGGDGPILRLNNGGIFPVRQYFKQQPQRAEWLAWRLPDLLELEQHWKASMGGSSEPERTLKSDVFAEWEAISRTAKVRWADETDMTGSTSNMMVSSLLSTQVSLKSKQSLNSKPFARGPWGMNSPLKLSP